MTRGVFGKLVVVIVMAFEASTRLELALMLPASFANQWGGLFSRLVVVVAPVALDTALGRRRFTPILDGRARVLIIRGWKPPFHHLEQLQ